MGWGRRHTSSSCSWAESATKGRKERTSQGRGGRKEETQGCRFDGAHWVVVGRLMASCTMKSKSGSSAKRMLLMHWSNSSSEADLCVWASVRCGYFLHGGHDMPHLGQLKLRLELAILSAVARKWRQEKT